MGELIGVLVGLFVVFGLPTIWENNKAKENERNSEAYIKRRQQEEMDRWKR